ncbi:MAG TPA: hypothetical protein VNO31_42285 [Umezawaea sp.]|nr:hypothetical protein [Umezawaea sp.]
MSREEARALTQDATPFWYGGDRQTIVSFTVRPEGLDLSLTCFATDEQSSTVIRWKEFAEIVADIPLMAASAAASREAGRPVHIGRPVAEKRGV